MSCLPVHITYKHYLYLLEKQNDVREVLFSEKKNQHLSEFKHKTRTNIHQWVRKMTLSCICIKFIMYKIKKYIFFQLLSKNFNLIDICQKTRLNI